MPKIPVPNGAPTELMPWIRWATDHIKGNETKIEQQGYAVSGVSSGLNDTTTLVGGQSVILEETKNVVVEHSDILQPQDIPLTPSDPILATSPLTVTASWDGLLEGAAPGVGFRNVVAEVSLNGGGWVRTGQPLTSAGEIVISAIAPGTNVGVRFIAINNSDTPSEPSLVASITAEGVARVDLDADINDAIDQAVNDSGNALTQVGNAIATSLDEYVVSSSSTVAPGPGAAWSEDTPDWQPGEYVWRRQKNTHINGSVSYSAPSVITGNDGTPGEDAVLMSVVSSKGNAFKNNTISTVLSVTIFKGSQIITNYTQLQAAFGTSAYLEWYWRRDEQASWSVISSADPRLSQAGFALTVSPADVTNRTDFRCILQQP
jgi:hypothetical protein